jgi:hypothetical protein
MKEKKPEIRTVASEIQAPCGQLLASGPECLSFDAGAFCSDTEGPRGEFGAFCLNFGASHPVLGAFCSEVGAFCSDLQA